MTIVKAGNLAELWLIDAPVSGKCGKCGCIFIMDPEVDEIRPGKVCALNDMHGWANCPHCDDMTILTPRDKT